MPKRCVGVFAEKSLYNMSVCATGKRLDSPAPHIRRDPVGVGRADGDECGGAGVGVYGGERKGSK